MNFIKLSYLLWGKFILSLSFFLGILTIYIIITLLSCYVVTLNSKTFSIQNNENSIPVYLMSNGVHVDIVVPVKNHIYDWSTEVQYKHTKNASIDDTFLAFGWGDKGFYLDTPDWSQLKFSTVIQALSGFNQTLMHTKYMSLIEIQHLLQTQPHQTKKLFLNLEQYQILVQNIEKQFVKNEQGHFVLTNTSKRYNKKDSFYDAHNHYSLFQTCNTWINELLKKSVKKACLWTPFAHCILEKY